MTGGRLLAMSLEDRARARVHMRVEYVGEPADRGLPQPGERGTVYDLDEVNDDDIIHWDRAGTFSHSIIAWESIRLVSD
jgi:hypothetical protein